MNFLAHLYLSYESDEIAIGNYIADFVKGKQIQDFDDGIRKGILIHREIDRFTDSHEIVKQSKARLWNQYRHYSPVIVDIFYDHFLAKYWKDFSEEPLKSYTVRKYMMISKYSKLLPDGAKKTFKYMKMTDWLYNYQFMEGIDMALKGLSRRTKFNSKMEHASKELKLNYELYKGEFVAFFPILENHIQKFSS